MTDSRIVITGVGVMSALGNDSETLWRNLLEGQSAVREWEDLNVQGFRVTRACRISELDGDPLRRGSSLALAAAEQAVACAGASLDMGAGVYIGSTLGESAAFEAAAEGGDLDLNDYRVPSFTEAVRNRFSLHGPKESLATACAAGNYAIGSALNALRSGDVSMALAGGVEPFSRLSLVGFSRSRAMAPDFCRPFDRKRSGMMLGEGAAIFVLECARDALARGAKPLAEVVSLGLSCDAYHATAPLPDGSGILDAMRAALANGRIAADEIDWVNAHGSGTRASDAAEAQALKKLFPGSPLVSGSKGALGHALGASSALEIAICIEGLKAQLVPPTFGHDEADADGMACTREPTQRSIRYVLNNAFAFGGLNSSLLLKRWDA